MMTKTAFTSPSAVSSLLSDDGGQRFRFIGAFFVLCAQDHMNFRTPADFQYFEYPQT